MDKRNYFIVRVPGNVTEAEVTDALLALSNRVSAEPAEAVLVNPIHDDEADCVRRIRAAYDADDYDGGDEIRQGVEEDLFHTFSDLVEDGPVRASYNVVASYDGNSWFTPSPEAGFYAGPFDKVGEAEEAAASCRPFYLHVAVVEQA